MAEKESPEEELAFINNLSNKEILDLVNNFLPQNFKIEEDKGDKIIPLAKQLMLSINMVEPKIDFSLAKDFLNLAKNDIKTSKSCYRRKDFPNSTYHLQQATEKLAKTHGIAHGILLEKDLFEIGHKTPRAFIKIMKDNTMKKYLDSLKILHPELQTETTGLYEQIDKSIEELALLKYEQIQTWLNLASNIDKNLKNTQIDKVVNKVGLALDPNRNKITKMNFSTIKFSSSFIKLYIISCLTYPHEIFTRYPDKKIKPVNYNLDLGIVKATPEIYNFLLESMKLIEKFIEWKEKNASLREM